MKYVIDKGRIDTNTPKKGWTSATFTILEEPLKGHTLVVEIGAELAGEKLEFFLLDARESAQRVAVEALQAQTVSNPLEKYGKN